MSAAVQNAEEKEPIVFAGPSEEQQRVRVEQAIKEGHLTFSLLRHESPESQ
jgi:hypothetical protein